MLSKRNIVQSNRAEADKPAKRRWFRFSMRSLLWCCLVIAILSGLVGRSLTTFVSEQRLSRRLDQMGAITSMGVLPPKGRVQKLLYEIGARSIFKRLIAIDFSPIKDANSSYSLADRDAKSIGKLQLLRLLDLQNANATDEQMAMIGKSPSLMTLRLSGNPAVTNVGLQNFAGHPELRSVQLTGLDISNADFRTFLETLPKLELPIKQVIATRAEDECVLGGFRLSWTSQSLIAELNAMNEKSMLTRDRVMRQWNSSSVQILSRINMEVNGTDSGEIASITIVSPEPDLGRLAYAYSGVAIRDCHVTCSSDHFTESTVQQLSENRIKHLSLILDSNGLLKPRNLMSLSWLESLRFACDGYPPFFLLDGLERLHALSLADATHVFDDDMVELATHSNLKVLGMPSAWITTFGLQKLIDSELELDELELPSEFAKFENLIVDSGLAKKLTITSNVALNTKATLWVNSGSSDSLIVRMGRAIKHAEFPRPDDSPVRPEDKMLVALQNASQISAGRYKYSDSDYAQKLLENALDRFQGAEVTVGELLDADVVLTSFFTFPDSHQDEQHYEWQVICNLYGELASIHEENGEYDVALEMRIRQIIWANPNARFGPSLPKDEMLAWLCMKTSEPQKALRQFLILNADQKETKWAAAPRVERLLVLNRPAPIAIAAPEGKQITSIKSDNVEATVFTDVLRKVGLRGERAELVFGTRVVYVNVADFPLTVETEPFKRFAD